MSKKTRSTIPWYMLVDEELDEYTKALSLSSGLTRSDIVRRAIRELRIIPNEPTFAEWLKESKEVKAT
jgi:hypothetical protein